MSAALEPAPYPDYDYCRAVVELLPAFVFEARLSDDGVWRVVWSNPGFRQTFGVDVQEFEATGGWDGRLHPDDRLDADRCRGALQQGGSTDGMLRMMTTRGWRRLRTFGQAFADPVTGRIDRAITCGIDVTAEHEAVQSLLESQERYRLATDAMAGIVSELDVTTGRIECSQGVQRVLGYGEGEIGPDVDAWLALVHPDDLERVAGALSQSLSNADSFEAEYRLRHRSGEYVDIWNRSVVQRDAAGRPIRLIGCGIDVTELRSTQRKAAGSSRLLQQTTDLLQQAQELARLGSWSQRVSDNQRFWSVETYRLLGLPVGTLPTTGQLLAVIHPDDVERLRRAWHAALEFGGPTFDVEHRILVQGELRWVRELARIERDGEGNAVSVLGTIQDITERKLLEQEVIAAANREQERIGHDLHDGLGQELTGISLLLQGLSTRLAREYPALSSEAEAIAELVSQSISNTRAIATGLSPVAVAQGGLSDALRALGTRMRSLYGVPTSVEIEPGPRFQLGRAVEIQLYRIAQEAVTNAARHSGAASITIRLARSPVGVVLEVADDGRGLPAESPDDVGLGLRILRYRAEVINAEMRIASVPGGGTVVRVVCPAERPGGETP